MKLAEALLLRSDLQKKVNQLTARITPLMVIRNGKAPQEDPVKLMAVLRKDINKLEAIIIKINKTNNSTVLPDGTPLMEALAKRDGLKLLITQLRAIRQAAQIHGQSYDNLSNTIKITDIQSEMDQMGRAFREIDSQIQGINWATELIE